MNTLGNLNNWQKMHLNLSRGLAAQCVVLGHAGHYFLPDSTFPFSRLGPFGVLIFFLISGYLIAHCILDNYRDPGYDFGRFLADRASRILTPFVPALFLVAALDSLVIMSPGYEYARDYTATTWIGNLLMFQDYPLFQVLRRIGVEDASWFVGPFGSGRPFWTLNIEWGLYLAFGATLFYLVRGDRPSGAVILLLVAVYSLIPLYHFAGGFGETLIYAWLFGMTAAFIDSGHLQVNAGLFNRLQSRLPQIRGLLITAPWLIMGVRAFAQKQLEFDLVFAALLTVSLFALFWHLGACRTRPDSRLAGVSAALAHYSYSLYLVHNSVVVLLALKVFPGEIGPGYLLLAFVASQLAAIAFWWLFERHYRVVRRWLRRMPDTAVELVVTSPRNGD